MGTLRPHIDYKHSLRELSVNRKDPCEIIRELVSNSYDAGATRILTFPVLQEVGFVFFDNGTGLDTNVGPTGISPYESFFSIGKSTKAFGEYIGHKCQGSKLCFASTRFAIITRTREMASWNYKVIENPKTTLDPTFDITPSQTSEPWTLWNQLLPHPDERTRPILAQLDQGFFETSFPHGTMLIVLGLEVQGFNKYYDVAELKKSYLYNYIRFSTRHGDVRLLRSDVTGFAAHQEEAFKKMPGCNAPVELLLWSDAAGLQAIPRGFPYLPKLPPGEQVKKPSEVSRLRDGRFVARHAKIIQHSGRKYCLTMAVDGNRRAHEEYPDLDRRGARVSGIRLTDQRGIFVCCQGIKICPYTRLFEEKALTDYSVLGETEAQTHYVLMIDGNFELVTDRNSLSEVSLKVLQSPDFVEHIKKFLDEFSANEDVFSQLVAALKKENIDARREAQAVQLKDLKRSLPMRARFRIKSVPHLEQHWFVAPEPGEEHWVGALYTLLAHAVPKNSPLARFWTRPLTFSGRGIDSVGTDFLQPSMKEDDLRSIEYKYRFSAEERFNHPMSLTTHVVCWTMDPPPVGTTIWDDYDSFGQVTELKDASSFGYRISGIRGADGSEWNSDIEVICLKGLMKETFEVEEVLAPSMPPPRKGKGKVA